MGELIMQCKKILQLIDENYPKQKEYPGIIKKIYDLVEKTYLAAKNGIVVEDKVNLKSLARQFIDDTTHFNSPVLIELDKVIKILLELQEKSK